MSKSDLLHLRILAPTAVIYDGEVTSVSSENHVGSFDVLAGHTNFFTLLSTDAINVDEQGKKLNFKVQGGIMKVHDDSITIYGNLGKMH